LTDRPRFDEDESDFLPTRQSDSSKSRRWRVAKAKASKIPPDRLQLYEKLIATLPEIERKGDVHPYTAINGNMFTYLDQSGTMGLRLAKEDVEAFLAKYKTTLFESYGVVKKDYVTVPATLLEKTGELKKYLVKSVAYVKTLKPK
jgi:hypothetical protein